jgi:hypothetical protein
MANWRPDFPTQGTNVRVPRAYGAGHYGESLYGRWEGTFVIQAPCLPTWGAGAAPCQGAWVGQGPCAPAWTKKGNC